MPRVLLLGGNGLIGGDTVCALRRTFGRDLFLICLSRGNSYYDSETRMAGLVDLQIKCRRSQAHEQPLLQEQGRSMNGSLPFSALGLRRGRFRPAVVLFERSAP